ncbi:hypothetical protein [Ramlibacter rhizophilus]|uniref:Uncharacterized protein n=1 Tax=Ramlibacter rhizophilus TaxID=1781167 RepID=A0A4Z0BZC3_9BURK|nr:hypothetical protein [Ramlibacter rhizophilus]TFZ03365.1 hypothetical protein EZ242_05640 [Ramlibacter rhizophilus]
MPSAAVETNPLAGRVFEGEAAAVLATLRRSKNKTVVEGCQRELRALSAAADFYDLWGEAHQELSLGRMTEHRRREAEVDLLLDAVIDVATSFPQDHWRKTMATRFFQLLAECARCMLAATQQFHPVMFRELINEGWRALGRAEELGWALEQSHESGARGGGEGVRRTTSELRAALLEGTAVGTIEELAQRYEMSTRNVSFAKAWARRRQPI